MVRVGLRGVIDRSGLGARARRVVAGGVVTAALAGVPVAGPTHLANVLIAVVPRLPVLGPVRTVDRNDVGDPYILSVPPGTPPPGDLAQARSGRHGRPFYESAQWTAATAAKALHTGWYVLFDTTDWHSNVPAAVSTDLVHWTAAPDALPVLPDWAAPNVSMTWGPAATRTPHGWVLYFSTEAGATHHECIGAATSTSPAGPYSDHSTVPLECQADRGGSIDPSVVHGPGGHSYLVWKNDGNSEHLPDTLWSAPLSPDGLAITGSPAALLSATDAWDDGIVEAPAMVPATQGGWWLFYAAGSWDSPSYATGLAYCPSVSGPCLPAAPTPYLSTTKSMIAPGTLDTVRAHDGQLWAAWTALQPERVPWSRSRTWYDRVLEIAPVLSH